MVCEKLYYRQYTPEHYYYYYMDERWWFLYMMRYTKSKYTKVNTSRMVKGGGTCIYIQTFGAGSYFKGGMDKYMYMHRN